MDAAWSGHDLDGRVAGPRSGNRAATFRVPRAAWRGPGGQGAGLGGGGASVDEDGRAGADGLALEEGHAPHQVRLVPLSHIPVSTGRTGPCTGWVWSGKERSRAGSGGGRRRGGGRGGGGPP